MQKNHTKVLHLKSLAPIAVQSMQSLRSGLVSLVLLLLTSQSSAQDIMSALTQGADGKTPVVKNFPDSFPGVLTARGEPLVYTRENSNNFEYIGMPVGGLCAGQLYLGGDGKLWFWDLFNLNYQTFQIKGVEAYEFPYERSKPEDANARMIENGFKITTRSGGETVTKILDRDGIETIEFLGQYPIGEVRYRDSALPVDVKLEAYSPFVPLETFRSLYPATVLSYTITNTSDQPVEADLTGWLENAVLTGSRELVGVQATLENTVATVPGVGRRLTCSMTMPQESQPRLADVKIVPDEKAYMHDSDFWTVDKIDATEVQDTLPQFTAGKGKLHRRTSLPFNLERPLVTLEVRNSQRGGGTVIRVVVDDEVVAVAVGPDQDIYKRVELDVSRYQGKAARIELINGRHQGWGRLMVQNIMQRDNRHSSESLKRLPDAGSMTLTAIDPAADADATSETRTTLDLPSEKALVSELNPTVSLQQGESKTITYVLTWHFPNTRVVRGEPRNLPRYYAKPHKDAAAVSDALIADFNELDRLTRLWRDVWYDSTLPYWFLDRTFLNMSTLATSTANYWTDEIFMGWEGAYHSPGTTTHVWGYIQAIAMLFPEFEISLREKVDFRLVADGGGMLPDGRIRFRWFYKDLAVDGQSGIILRSYLIHRSATDESFLKSNYAGIKRAMEGLTELRDADHDGTLTGAQHNTRDAAWYGKVTWLSLHYTTALRAMAEMAEETGDQPYAAFCRTTADKGRQYIEQNLFNGEFFFHEADPEHPDSPGTYNGLEYSQLLGQSWAYQVGMGEVIAPEKARTALESMWRYNFSTDVGPYREKFKGGRWYAMPGEGGLIACTWPKGGSEALKKGSSHFATYNNECQNGYEYAATSLMMWQGMPHHALAHMWYMHNDRYHGGKRNPWNEVEWGMHYSRSMASYGLFTAASGFEYHGPKGHLGFAPNITPERFKSAFTGAKCWGSFEQERSEKSQTNRFTIKNGQLKLNSLAFEIQGSEALSSVTVSHNGQPVVFNWKQDGPRIKIEFAAKTTFETKDRCEVILKRQI